MTDTPKDENLARDHERFKQLMRSVLWAFVIIFAIGGIGGYLVYLFLPTGKWPAFVLYIPGLLAAVVCSFPIRKRKKEWFPTPESLKAASEYKPPKS